MLGAGEPTVTDPATVTIGGWRKGLVGRAGLAPSPLAGEGWGEGAKGLGSLWAWRQSMRLEGSRRGRVAAGGAYGGRREYVPVGLATASLLSTPPPTPPVTARPGKLRAGKLKARAIWARCSG